jgi:ABC-type arginine transport system permease subunit
MRMISRNAVIGTLTTVGLLVAAYLTFKVDISMQDAKAHLLNHRLSRALAEPYTTPAPRNWRRTSYG